MNPKAPRYFAVLSAGLLASIATAQPPAAPLGSFFTRCIHAGGQAYRTPVDAADPIGAMIAALPAR